MAKLPNHNPDYPTKKENYFSDEKIQELHEKYAFKDGYPLAQHLEDAAFWYECDKQDRHEPPKSEQTTLLEELRDRTASLLDVLERIGMPEREFLYEYVDPVLLNDNQELRGKLRDLHNAAKASLHDLESAHPPSTKDFAIRSLIRNLRHIYMDGTGRAEIVTCTDNTETNKRYRGRFFDFTVDCLGAMKIKKPTNSLAKLIQEVRKTMENHSR